MAAFQETREQTEQKMRAHLLSESERKPSFAQRGLTSEFADIAQLVTSVNGFVSEVMSVNAHLKEYDAGIVIARMNSQGTYDTISHTVECHHLLTLTLFHISKGWPYESCIQ